jgi:PilZ domain-containing protein
MPESTIREGSHKDSHMRRWRRYSVNVPIRVIIQRAMKSTIVQGRGSALSEGGMAIFAGAELKPGEHIAVEFTPPYSAPPIRVEARVCNRRGYDYGLEFLDRESEQREEVATFRNHLASLVGVVESSS